MAYSFSHKQEVALGILHQIKEAILRLQERTQQIKKADDFLQTPEGMEKLDAACMLLIAIGESLKSFDKTTEKQILYTDPSIPWKNIMGIRDIIAHHYFDIDAEEIFEVIHHELSPLLNSIQRFIDQLSDTGNKSYG